MKNVIFIFGPPCSGKTTLISSLNNNNYNKFLLGDHLREKAIYNKYINDRINKGITIDSIIIQDIIEEKIVNSNSDLPFVMDGFPRNLDNIINFKNNFSEKIKIIKCVEFNCNKDILLQRLNYRKLYESRPDNNKNILLKRINRYNNFITLVKANNYFTITEFNNEYINKQLALQNFENILIN